jgi:hypothetical protein
MKLSDCEISTPFRKGVNKEFDTPAHRGHTIRCPDPDCRAEATVEGSWGYIGSSTVRSRNVRYAITNCVRCGKTQRPSGIEVEVIAEPPSIPSPEPEALAELAQKLGIPPRAKRQEVTSG